MYAKVFAQIFDSSLREKWQAWVVFVAMLALADSEDEVDMTPQALAARTGLPGSVISEGIEFLERPDENSRSPEEGGRRIVRLDDHRPWGWRIVNRRKYRAIRDQSERREYMREYMRNYRKPESTDVNTRKPHEVGSRKEEVGNRKKSKASGSEPSSPKVLTLTLTSVGGEAWNPTENEVAVMKNAYPGVDIAGEFARMEAWGMANPTKRKTLRGLPRFVNNWLSGQQDKPRTNGTVDHELKDWEVTR